MKRRIDWRGILARLPLPMLALAASYGVYSFALLFVPPLVAGVQAAAFELTYIGLAVTTSLDGAQRKRATTISIGAVVASIVYNTLAGWFHRQPALLTAGGDLAWLMFAILHGAPLAWVAYLVADLLLHSSRRSRRPRELRALVRRLACLLRTARVQLAPLQAMLATARAELEATRAALAREQAETQPLREKLATIEPTAASLGAALEEARNQLRMARDEARKFAHEAASLRDRPAPMPPSRAQIIAHVRAALAESRSLNSIADELGFSESTLRGWLASATNGHAIEASA